MVSIQAQFMALNACLDSWDVPSLTPVAEPPCPQAARTQVCDPFAYCVSQPTHAPGPVDLWVPLAAHPLNVLPEVDDMSSTPSYLEVALQPLHNPMDPSLLDPIEGSEQSGSGLPAVGSALATHPAGEPPGDHKVLLWTLVCMSGSEHHKKNPCDWVE